MIPLRRMFPALVLLVALAGCGSSSSTKSTTTSTKSTATTTPPGGAALMSANVAISNYKFAPPTVTLKQGGKITFTNKDSVEHTATADDGKTFDSGTLNQGQSKTVTFPTAGTFTYHCAFHAFMMAKVVVVA